MASPTKDPVRGGWRMTVTVTVNGVQRRRFLRGRTRSAVSDAAEAARAELRRGAPLPAGGQVTLSEWLESWIASRAVEVRPKTITGYRTDAKHIKRAIGNIRLDRLTPENIDSLLRSRLDAGAASSTVIHLRATLSACLNGAVAHGRISQNPVKLAATPRLVQGEMDPLTPTEVEEVMQASAHVRSGVRWVLAIATGLRQGEVLGLQWDDLDTDTRSLHVRRSLYRRPWKHGCPERKPCGLKPQRCPNGIQGELLAGELKTSAGRRSLALPKPLVDLLEAHHRAQAAERLKAGEEWEQGPGGGWIFATQVGTPVDPRNDLRQWKRLLAKTQIKRRVRIHDLRHTAATLQLVAGTDSRVLQGLFGWSSITMTTRYAHVVDAARRQAADLMTQMLWPSDEEQDRDAG